MESDEETAVGSSPFVEDAIEIYLRVKPVANPTKKVEYDAAEGKVEFHVPRDAVWGLVNNTRERYDFAFNGVFGPEATQDDVFHRVARRAVLGCLDGYNGTVFAYGQTGSGKTFTISGGVDHFSQRGITPRALELLFLQVQRQCSPGDVCVRVSYLEIYNEVVYDLLGEPSPDAPLDLVGPNLPRVTLLEEADGSLAYRNLSQHVADSAEEALGLLYKGDMARAVAETSMNTVSSRSHCVFTAHVTSRQSDSDTVRKAKLHIVDLAGSERVGKSGIDGTLLTEAKHINLSLSYLEQVIVALQERAAGVSRSHVPYRNSALTSVLRDSLGGNARTAMVATISPLASAIEEGVSTCRFAQRVAMVTNSVSKNEEVDPQLVIKRLKDQLVELRAELRLCRGEEDESFGGSVGADEAARLREAAALFLRSGDDDCAAPETRGSLARVRVLFAAFRELCRSHQSSAQRQGAQEAARRARLHVAQRDAELATLTSLLVEQTGAPATGDPTTSSAAPAPSLQLRLPHATALDDAFGREFDVGDCDGEAEGEVAVALLERRGVALDAFRKSARRASFLSVHRGAALAAEVEAARALAGAANGARERLAATTRASTQRAQQALRAALAGGAAATVGFQWKAAAAAAEARAAEEAEGDKQSYRDATEALAAKKGRILELQRELQDSAHRVQSDFQAWLRAAAATALTPSADEAPAGADARQPVVSHDALSTTAATAEDLVSADFALLRVDPIPPPPHSPPPQSSPPHSQSSDDSALVEMLTGDPETDADIRAFYAARQRRLAGAR